MFHRKNNHTYDRSYPYGIQEQNHLWGFPRQYATPPYPLNPNWPQQLPPGMVNPYPYGQGGPTAVPTPVMPHPSPNNYPVAQTIFQNPLQPQEVPQPYYYQNPIAANQGYLPNPYPQHSFTPKQSSGIQSVMNSFKAQDGTVDINKMLNTAGMMMSAVNQVSSMIKGFGGMLKV